MSFSTDPKQNYYIQSSIVEMREHPTQQSKVVSQAIFSEKIQVLKKDGEWVYIVTPDHYAGWIPSTSFISRQTLYETTHQTSRLAAHLYGLKDIEYGPLQTLPYGARLQILDSSDARWLAVSLPNNREGFIQKGDVEPFFKLHNKADLIPFSQQFIGLPYTWGGRSSFGYDCSGFIQMLYQQIGIYLQRDSHQQASDLRFLNIDLDDLQPGDLLFFGNTRQEIKHVGMHINDGSFIHATSRENQPWIRISHLSDFEWSGHQDAAYPYRIGRQYIQESI